MQEKLETCCYFIDFKLYRMDTAHAAQTHRP